jgi:hypothetical protein
MPTYINKQDFGSLDAQWYELPLFDDALNLITTNNGEVNLISFDKKLYSNDIHVGFAFTPTAEQINVQFSSFIMCAPQGTNKANDFKEYYISDIMKVSRAILFIEASKLKYLPVECDFNYDLVKGRESYDISDLYLGEDLTVFDYGNKYEIRQEEPVFDPNGGVYKTSIDNPISIEEMITEIGLTAYDVIDGDLTNQITIKADGDYISKVFGVSTIQERILGSYPVTLKVTDSSGNYTECIINIEVTDEKAPNIEETSTLEHIINVDNESLSIDEVVAGIDVIDNYSEVDYQIIKNDYLGNERNLGSYEIVIRFIDSSGNFSDITVNVVTNDEEPPVFYYSASVCQLSYLDNYSLDYIIDQLDISVTDNYYDVDFEIIEDVYTTNIGNVGEYYFNLKATDGHNNSSELKIFINIIDDVAPIFFVNDTLVLTNINKLLTTVDIKAMLIEKDLAKNANFSIEVITDNYTNSSNLIGDYQMRVKLNYDNGEIEYRTIGISVSEIIENQSFFTKAWLEIKKIFQYIWNILKWPFEKLSELFN